MVLSDYFAILDSQPTLAPRSILASCLRAYAQSDYAMGKLPVDVVECLWALLVKIFAEDVQRLEVAPFPVGAMPVVRVEGVELFFVPGASLDDDAFEVWYGQSVACTRARSREKLGRVLHECLVSGMFRSGSP